MWVVVDPWKDRWIVGLIFLCLTIGFSFFNQVWASEFNHMQSSKEPLLDVGFHVIPEYNAPHGSAIVDFLVAIVFLSGVGVVLWQPSPYRDHHLTRLIWCHTFLYAIRSITIIATVLPNPHPHCEWIPQRNSPDSGWTELFVDVFNILTLRVVTCGDVMYSGHTVSATAGLLCWFFTPNPPQWKLFMSVFTLGVFASIISTRFHYTDDVIIGFALTCFVHLAYYLLQYIKEYPSLEAQRRSHREERHHEDIFVLCRCDQKRVETQCAQPDDIRLWTCLDTIMYGFEYLDGPPGQFCQSSTQILHL